MLRFQEPHASKAIASNISWSRDSYSINILLRIFWPVRRAIGHSTRMATDSPTGTDNSDTALLELPPKIGCEQGFNPVPSRPRTIRAG